MLEFRFITAGDTDLMVWELLMTLGAVWRCNPLCGECHRQIIVRAFHGKSMGRTGMTKLEHIGI